MRLLLLIFLLLGVPLPGYGGNVTTMREALMMGSAAYKRGEVQKADTLYSAALRDADQVFGETSEEAFHILSPLANLKFLLGRNRAGEALMVRYLKICKIRYADRPVAMAFAMTRAAEVFVVRKDYARAAQLSGKAVPLLLKKIGPDHPDVVAAVNRYAGYLIGLKKYQKAEEIAAPMVKQVIKKSGQDYFLTASLWMTLGDVARGKGELEIALRHYRQAHKIRVKLYGHRHIETLQAVSRLIDAGLVMGQWQAMQGYLEQGLAIARELYSEENPMVRQFKQRLDLVKRKQRGKEVTI
ncbi:hypothetical protein Mmc1_0708 [Magnetococcus marinus MC-1]|uniref:Tetratricopeptide TPR_2 repeat protein n=1 Tax=Magnetococcus marinus (strain ATCC BAA-1437 / JCM 17883 / MC-1) TaxID=156889 RepID=A0L5I6_MAGMM|nr:tetratricopeptide repeat protein [Magnetococcus marinus]ABK43229.1 hypothetical protein Mmc1_0708 [Magnetococcus marinus MC-1]